MCQRKD
ncbi:hypothetical protein R3I94_014165 [Phoxinus phoxinus]